MIFFTICFTNAVFFFNYYYSFCIWWEKIVLKKYEILGSLNNSLQRDIDFVSSFAKEEISAIQDDIIILNMW